MRAFLVVIDSVGIGGAPDAGSYFNDGVPDTGANTVLHIAESCADAAERYIETTGAAEVRLPTKGDQERLELYADGGAVQCELLHSAAGVQFYATLEIPAIELATRRVDRADAVADGQQG